MGCECYMARLTLQISSKPLFYQPAIYHEIAGHHPQTHRNFSVFAFAAVRKVLLTVPQHSVGHAPCIALAHNGSHLVHSS